ncbi:MAG: hypothetical protein AB1635_15430, partial [Acidobacteriota bacterium]
MQKNVHFGLALALVLTFAASGAQASDRDDDKRRAPIPAPDAALNACFNARSGELKVVAGASECRKHEQFVSIPLIAPAGPTGPQGPVGPEGPAG